MRVLVLGASGYLGGRVAEFLASAGHTVAGQWRTAPVPLGPESARMTGTPVGWDTVVTGDLREAATREAAIAWKPEAVVHLVALNHKQSEQSRADALAVNAGTVWEWLEALAPYGLQRFIYLSTQQAYGRLPLGPVTEDTPLRPLNAYGVTHAAAEAILTARAPALGVQAASIRLSNGCGAPAWKSADCWWLVVNDLCRTARTAGVLQLASDGTPTRDFVHVQDLASAVETLLTTSTPVAGAYNVGQGETLTILELAHRVADRHVARYGVRPPVLLPGGVASETAEGHRALPRFSYETARMHALGWSASRGVDAAIDEVFAALDASSASPSTSAGAGR